MAEKPTNLIQAIMDGRAKDIDMRGARASGMVVGCTDDTLDTGPTLNLQGTTIASFVPDRDAAKPMLEYSPLLWAPHVLRAKLLSDGARLPTKGSEHAAGWDLYACLTPHADPDINDTITDVGGTPYVTVRRGQVTRVPTGLAVAMYPGTYGRVAPRSGLAARHGVDTLAGVVDADYRGEVFVLLTTHADAGVTVRHGDRIAQLVPELVLAGGVLQVENLDATGRGKGGFGSTGVGAAGGAGSGGATSCGPTA